MGIMSAGCHGVVLLMMMTSMTLAEVIPRRECHDTSSDLYKFSARQLNDSQLITFDQYRGKQEPGANATEIFNGIRYVRPGDDFVPQLTLFAKTEVNGANEDPLFTFLKNACPYTETEFSTRLFYEPKKVGDISWNFEKFLIGPNGKPFSRYHPKVVEPSALQEDIETLNLASNTQNSQPVQHFSTVQESNPVQRSRAFLESGREFSPGSQGAIPAHPSATHAFHAQYPAHIILPFTPIV